MRQLENTVNKTIRYHYYKYKIKVLLLVNVTFLLFTDIINNSKSM